MPTIAARPQQVKSVPSINVPFAPIPLDLMRRKDLSPLAKLVFTAVANQARMRRGDSTWTNAQIAAAVGMTASGVRRPLDELEAAGLLERRYGASERVRESIRIAYSPSEVGAPASTQPTAAAPQHQPGCRPSINPVVVAAPTPLNTKNEERSENALALDSRGTEDKPSAGEIAAALRQMVGGKYAPALFEPKGISSTDTFSPPPCAAAAPPPNLKAMAKRVGYSAVALLSQTRSPRKTADEQLAELASRRIGRATP